MHLACGSHFHSTFTYHDFVAQSADCNVIYEYVIQNTSHPIASLFYSDHRTTLKQATLLVIGQNWTLLDEAMRM